MGKKAIAALLVGLALVSVHLAEAQQQAKVLRLGGLESVPHPVRPPRPSYSSESSVNLAMLRVRI
jgi:hypothetical protein